MLTETGFNNILLHIVFDVNQTGMGIGFGSNVYNKSTLLIIIIFNKRAVDYVPLLIGIYLQNLYSVGRERWAKVKYNRAKQEANLAHVHGKLKQNW